MRINGDLPTFGARIKWLLEELRFLATTMLASVIIVGVVILQSLAEQQALGMLKSSCFFSNKK